LAQRQQEKELPIRLWNGRDVSVEQMKHARSGR
jgi:hypothetical protein